MVVNTVAKPHLLHIEFKGFPVGRIAVAGVAGVNRFEQLTQSQIVLLKREYVHFVATDSHDDRKRTPELEEAAAYVAKKYGETYCGRLFGGNADVLLGGGYL